MQTTKLVLCIFFLLNFAFIAKTQKSKISSNIFSFKTKLVRLLQAGNNNGSRNTPKTNSNSNTNSSPATNSTNAPTPNTNNTPNSNTNNSPASNNNTNTNSNKNNNTNPTQNNKNNPTSNNNTSNNSPTQNNKTSNNGTPSNNNTNNNNGTPNNNNGSAPNNNTNNNNSPNTNTQNSNTNQNTNTAYSNTANNNVQTISFSKTATKTYVFNFLYFLKNTLVSIPNNTDLRPKFTSGSTSNFQFSLGYSSNNTGIMNAVYLTVPPNLSTITIDFDQNCLFPVAAASANTFPGLSISGEANAMTQSWTVTSDLMGFYQTQSTTFSQTSLTFPDLSNSASINYGAYSQTFTFGNNSSAQYQYIMLYCPLLSSSASSWNMSISSTPGSGSYTPTTTTTNNLNYTGLIIGVVVCGAVLLGVLIIASLVFIIIRRRNKIKEQEQNRKTDEDSYALPNFNTEQEEYLPSNNLHRQILAFKNATDTVLKKEYNKNEFQTNDVLKKDNEEVFQDLNSTIPTYIVPIHQIDKDDEEKGQNGM